MYGPFKVMLMSVIGMLASAAIGFPLNPSFTPEAVKEYKAKADVGDAEAQYLYSDALANGKGVAEDLPQAFIYAKKAADQGYERALRRVGLGYEQGWGGETNSVKAAECYSRFVTWATNAAEQGDANAQCSLGLMHEDGKGVKKDAKEAMKWWRKAAERGDARAETCLGLCYEYGKGVKKDTAEAVKWYRKAAEHGETFAQNNLGFYYDNGNGVEKDAKEAVKWYRKAAELGLADAQSSLGWHYLTGNGVGKDEVEAVKWYRKAAEQGDAYAQCCLGVCYRNGAGVEKDTKEAVKWYLKAAEQGLARAQWCLGDCYYNGYGVEKNEKEAMKWFRKAAEQGYLRERLMRTVYVHAGLVLVLTLLLVWWKRKNGLGLKEYWLDSWRRSLTFSGRSSKREYCITMLYLGPLSWLVLFLICLVIDVMFLVRLHEWYRLWVLVSSNLVFWAVTGGLVGGIIIGWVVFPLFAVEIRRLHDVGKSGWCEMLWLVPVLGWIQLWRLLLREGDPVKNKYGDPPIG